MKETTVPNREKPNSCRKGPAKPKPHRRAPNKPTGSRDARKLAALVLEVLAGARTPTDAAQAAGMSVPGYYHLEARCIQGLVKACEPRKKGKKRAPEAEIANLKREVERLQRENSRGQALLRLSQRSIGIPSTQPAAGKKKGGKGKRRRRPQARALKAAAEIKPVEVAPVTAEVSPTSKQTA